MKKSKKLLLAGISAMSLVAVATGAVSTFAWYTATAVANVNSASATNIITTSVGTTTGVNVAVEFQIVTVTSPELSAADGSMKVVFNGALYDSSSAATAAVGVYAIKGNIASGDLSKWTTANTARHVTFNLTAKAAEANSLSVVLLENGATTGASPASAQTHVIDTTIAADGTITINKVNNVNASDHVVSTVTYRTSAAAVFAARPAATGTTPETHESSYTAVYFNVAVGTQENAA